MTLSICDSHHNGIQHDNTLRNDIQHNDNQPNDTWQINKKCDTQHNDTI